MKLYLLYGSLDGSDFKPYANLCDWTDTRVIWNLESFWNHMVNRVITTAKGSVYYITAIQVLIAAEV